MNKNPKSRSSFSNFSFCIALSAMVVGCGGGSDSASPTTPTIPTNPITINTQPASSSIGLGNKLTLKVVAQGKSGLAYQWLFKGVAIYGAKNPEYTINAASASDTGDYQVEIIDQSGNKAQSQTASVTVTGLEKDNSQTQPTKRVMIASIDGADIKQPAWDQPWTLSYDFVVPPPPKNNWNQDANTFYIWGDVVYDIYGKSGKYKISEYDVNQIVPQLMIGNVLSGNNPDFSPTGTNQKRWVIQAQYFWEKDWCHTGCTSGNYALTGQMINVDPGEVVKTIIAYDPKSGKITASIGAKAGTSTIVSDRPFPNDPSLFTSWADFFKKAQAASKTDYVLAQPLLNIETDDLMQRQIMCSVLPFDVRGINMYGAYTKPKQFSQIGPISLPCMTQQVFLNF